MSGEAFTVFCTLYSLWLCRCPAAAVTVTQATVKPARWSTCVERCVCLDCLDVFELTVTQKYCEVCLISDFNISLQCLICVLTCFQGNGGCHVNAKCNMTGPGVRTCSCAGNFVGDGFTCRGTVGKVSSWASGTLLMQLKWMWTSCWLSAGDPDAPAQRLLPWADGERTHLSLCRLLQDQQHTNWTESVSDGGDLSERSRPVHRLRTQQRGVRSRPKRKRHGDLIYSLQILLNKLISFVPVSRTKISQQH